MNFGIKVEKEVVVTLEDKLFDEKLPKTKLAHLLKQIEHFEKKYGSNHIQEDDGLEQ